MKQEYKSLSELWCCSCLLHQPPTSLNLQPPYSDRKHPSLATTEHTSDSTILKQPYDQYITSPTCYRAEPCIIAMLDLETPPRPSNKRSSKPEGARTKSPVSSNRGLFIDSVWQCECKPRLPAERFQVKKEGPNKGKWFYTCQNSNKDVTQSRGCGFFLWAQDARLREEAAVLGNSRSEPRSTARKSKTTMESNAFVDEPIEESIEARFAAIGDDDLDSTLSDEEPSPSKRSSHANQTGAKRTSNMAGFDDRAARSTNSSVPMETPRKAPKLSNGYMTPDDTANADRTKPISVEELGPITPLQLKGKSRIDQLVTPRAARSASNFSAAFSIEPQSAASILLAETPGLTTPINQQSDPLDHPPSTPQKARHYDALEHSDTTDSELVKQIMAVLEPVKVPPDIRGNLRDSLSLFELRAEGVRKGRDLSREAVKERDRIIAERDATIVALQSQLSAARTANTLSRLLPPSGSDQPTVGQRLRS